MTILPNQRTIEYTNVFERNLEAYESGKFRIIGNQGATRSSKTYSISQLLSLYIPNKTKTSISIVSPSLPHLKRGARRDFLQILENAGVYNEDNFHKTDNIYNFDNGSYAEFFGVEDQGKVRGPGRKILYVNEANLVHPKTLQQLLFRTEELAFLDFNPVEETSHVYDLCDRPGSILIHSTYRDNSFLTEGQRFEIENLREADWATWLVFGLGQRGKSSEIIYTHWKLCERLPMKGEIFFGQDFGYNVPSALVLCELYEGAVYVQEWLYETKLTTSDLIEKYKELGVSKTIEIYCDNAEPKTIEEICRAGYNAKPANKDVTEGIKKVKSFPLYITENSPSVLKEIKGYKWRTDKDGKVIKDKDKDEPVKFNDHAMDAMRYAIFTKTHEPSYSWVGF